MTTDVANARARRRPGGRSARVRSAVLAAAAELLAELGYERVELPEIARRAGVHPTTVYRRWPTKSQLVGEALLERSRPLSPTPDSGALRTDLAQLLLEGAALVHTPAVRGLFEVLISDSTNPSRDLAAARDRFWAAHLDEARGVVDRAVARSELPPGTDPAALIDLIVGPALLRLLLMGQDLEPEAVGEIVDRAMNALRPPISSGSRPR
jgi:AcrR family transcriptional regulator